MVDRSGSWWIDPLGKMIPVDEFTHASVAKDILKEEADDPVLVLLKKGWTRVSSGKVGGVEAVTVQAERVTPGMLKHMGERLKGGASVMAQVKGETFLLDDVGKFGTFLRTFGKGILSAASIALMLNDLAGPAGATPLEEKQEIAKYKLKEGRDVR